jgi:hypothetical protein
MEKGMVMAVEKRKAFLTSLGNRNDKYIAGIARKTKVE